MMDEQKSVSDRLAACYTGAVYDVLRQRHRPAQVLPPTIRPLDPTTKVVGVAYTIGGRLVDGISEDETLLKWTTFLSQAPPDSMVMCQPNDSSLSHMGELSAETLQAKGVKGYVVDGGCRDSEFITRAGFPVFCRYLTPKDIVGRWMVDSLGEPITIGEVDVFTGDLVIADRDGIVVVPADMAEEVVGEVEETMQTEDLVRSAIRRGSDPRDAYLKYGKF